MNRNNVIFGIIVFMALSSCSVRQRAFLMSFSTKIHKKRITLGDGTNNWYFCKQTNNGTPNMLFMIGGSGHTSAIYTLARYWHALKELDADIYLLQKRHVGKRETGSRKCRDGFTADYYFDQIVADQEFFIKRIMADKENDGKKMIILGVSEGGTIAAKVAAEMNNVNYLAIIGSGGMTQSEELETQYPERRSELERFYKVVREHPATDSLAGGYTYKYWASFLFQNPTAYMLKRNIPVLLAMGAEDMNVPVASGRYVDSTFKSLHKNNLSYIEFEKCDHTLTDKEGKSHLSDFFRSLNKGVNMREGH